MYRKKDSEMVNKAWVEPVRGKRLKGRPRRRWEDGAREDLQVPHPFLKNALDRRKWRNTPGWPPPNGWEKGNGRKEEK